MSDFSAPVDERRYSDAERRAYLLGYEFALRNLHDEPVQADLHRLGREVHGGEVSR